MGGRIIVESVAGCLWNRWPDGRGIRSQGVPAHRLEYRQPSNRKSPSALNVIRNLAIEAFPEWKDRFEAMTEERVAEIAKEARRDE